MTVLVVCPICQRHVRATETECPHCQHRPEGTMGGERGDLAVSRAALGIGAIAAVASLALTACGEQKPTPDPSTAATTAAATTVAASVSGAPTTVAEAPTGAASGTAAPSGSNDVPAPVASGTATATATAAATHALAPTATATATQTVTQTRTRPPVAAYGPAPVNPKKRSPGGF